MYSCQSELATVGYFQPLIISNTKKAGLQLITPVEYCSLWQSVLKLVLCNECWPLVWNSNTVGQPTQGGDVNVFGGGRRLVITMFLLCSDHGVELRTGAPLANGKVAPQTSQLTTVFHISCRCRWLTAFDRLHTCIEGCKSLLGIDICPRFSVLCPR